MQVDRVAQTQVDDMFMNSQLVDGSMCAAEMLAMHILTHFSITTIEDFVFDLIEFYGTLHKYREFAVGNTQMNVLIENLWFLEFT